MKKWIPEDKPKVLGTVLITSFVFYQLTKYISERIKAKKILRKAKKRQHEKLSTPLPPLSLPSTDKQLYILSLKAYELADCIKAKTLTAEEVLSTYVNRAYLVGRKLNLSAEEVFGDAFRRLELVNDGLLAGVPISIKDEIMQLGCHSSGGVVRLAEDEDICDSILIKLLRTQGAVPFVRGSALQLMMWFETTSNLYGTAQNPWDILRTPGGSSGGDAGLVASSCTPLAIGSDIAGSIRIPAAFCGIYGFKPSSRRISGLECVSTHPKCFLPLEILVKSSYGPLGKCVEDLALVLKSWWRNSLWKTDCEVVPLVFNEAEYTKTGKMKIGFFDYNSVFECAGVVKKTIRNTVQQLQNLGHDVVEINTDMVPKAVELFIRATYAAPGTYMMEELQGEDPAWMYYKSYYQAKFGLSDFLFRVKTFLTGYKKLTNYLELAVPSSLSQFCEIGAQIEQFRAKFNEYWTGLGLDVVICPIWPLVAPLHKSTVKVSHAFSYSLLWNLLDYPAGVVPVCQVGEGEDIYESNEKDAFVWTAQEIMKNSVGLPISVQVVGRTYEDEKVLRAMKIVQDTFKFYKLPEL